jgi:transcriptional regulator with XRE-family HTH domain
MSSKLGNNIEALCKKKRFSVASLARMSGVAKTTIHSWIQGSSPNLGQLKKVCDVLEVPIYELAFGEPDPYQIPKEEILKEIFSGDVRVTLHKIERVPK